MDTPRLPRFARLFVYDSSDVDGPGLLATAIPAEMLETDEWVMLVDQAALMFPLALVEPIEHELTLGDAPEGSTLRQLVALVHAGEGDFRYSPDGLTQTVLTRPWRSKELIGRGVLCFYRGRDDHSLESLVDDDFYDVLTKDVAADGAQLEIRMIDGEEAPVLLASAERFLYRLDGKRRDVRLPSEAELEAERLISKGLRHADAETVEPRLAAYVAQARTGGPIVIGIDGHPRAVMFREG